MVNDITSAYSEIQELFKSKLTKAVNDAEVYRQKKMKLYKIFNGLAIFLLVCFICDILFVEWQLPLQHNELMHTEGRECE